MFDSNMAEHVSPIFISIAYKIIIIQYGLRDALIGSVTDLCGRRNSRKYSTQLSFVVLDLLYVGIPDSTPTRSVGNKHWKTPESTVSKIVI